jgi:hypothetical protein
MPAECIFCKAETELYDSGVPVCVKCADARTKPKPPATEQQIRRTLLQDVLELTARINEATREFEAVTGQIPSGLTHPDGVQRIKNASNALSIARKEMGTAHNRLNDYLCRGIVPDDLKQRSGS